MQPWKRGHQDGWLRAPPPTGLAPGPHVGPHSHPLISPNLQSEALRRGKSSGIKGPQEPPESPTRRPVTLDGPEDPLPSSRGLPAIGCDMPLLIGAFPEDPAPLPREPPGYMGTRMWGTDVGESGEGVRWGRGSGDSQAAECESKGRSCSAGAGEACNRPGESRVCTRGTGVRGAM